MLDNVNKDSGISLIIYGLFDKIDKNIYKNENYFIRLEDLSKIRIFSLKI